MERYQNATALRSQPSIFRGSLPSTPAVNPALVSYYEDLKKLSAQLESTGRVIRRRPFDVWLAGRRLANELGQYKRWGRVPEFFIPLILGKLQPASLIDAFLSSVAIYVDYLDSMLDAATSTRAVVTDLMRGIDGLAAAAVWNNDAGESRGDQLNLQYARLLLECRVLYDDIVAFIEAHRAKVLILREKVINIDGRTCSPYPAAWNSLFLSSDIDALLNAVNIV
ncbi:hypothetical protein PENSPDRAFT_694553 [Peniophora sp. CONT]|nr:hypothetical protein PENSPDRAFT_694553 [Peniophora sp. CONT]